VQDARNVERHLDAPQEGEFVNEALQQIAYAERLVLNKIDLVPPPPPRVFTIVIVPSHPSNSISTEKVHLDPKKYACAVNSKLKNSNMAHPGERR